MKKVVIVGGGPGGCMTANRLAKSMKTELQKGDLSITLITDSDMHSYQAGYLFMALDLQSEDHLTRKQSELLQEEVNLVIDPAVKIDVKGKKVTGKSGKEYPYDYLVIGTGSMIRTDITPGLKEAADDFYTSEGALKLKDKLLNFKGGKILCAIEMPHKCPVAFLELLFMLDEFYKMKGIRDKVKLAYTYPMEQIHMALPVAKFVQPLLDERNIAYHTGFVVDKVDDRKRQVYSKNGAKLDYDLLIAVPTHRGAQVIFDSGLGDDQGWIDTDPHTLKMVGTDHVYVIGDASNLHTRMVSKAGSAAHYQSEVVANNIERELKSLKPNSFYNGKVFCFIETGLNNASCIQMSYNNPPKPAPPSTLLHWFKLSFNELYWPSVRGML